MVRKVKALSLTSIVGYAEGHVNSKPPPSGTAGEMVGTAGFEPTAFCAQGRRATRLRYAPMRMLAEQCVRDTVADWLNLLVLRSVVVLENFPIFCRPPPAP